MIATTKIISGSTLLETLMEKLTPVHLNPFWICKFKWNQLCNICGIKYNKMLYGLYTLYYVSEYCLLLNDRYITEKFNLYIMTVIMVKLSSTYNCAYSENFQRGSWEGKFWKQILYNVCAIHTKILARSIHAYIERNFISWSLLHYACYCILNYNHSLHMWLMVPVSFSHPLPLPYV